MGGRGSSGSVVSRGGFSLPAVAGSAKQISYANDIMKSPYDRLGLAAKNADTLNKRMGGKNSYAKEAEAFKAAQRQYSRDIQELAKRGGDRFTASFVIQKKYGFLERARNIAFEEFKKRGLDTTLVNSKI